MMVRIDEYEWIDPSKIESIYFQFLNKRSGMEMVIDLSCGRTVKIKVDEDLRKSATLVKYLMDAKSALEFDNCVDFTNLKNPFMSDEWDESFPNIR